MEDRETRRKAKRDAVIREVLMKRAQSYGKTPGHYDDDIAAVVSEVLDAQEKVESGEIAAAAPVRQPERAKPAAAGDAAAPAAVQPAPAAPVRPVRTKSSEETMVFVIRTNAIRGKRKEESENVQEGSGVAQEDPGHQGQG
jgi:hypothetical protein